MRGPDSCTWFSHSRGRHYHWFFCSICIQVEHGRGGWMDFYTATCSQQLCSNYLASNHTAGFSTASWSCQQLAFQLLQLPSKTCFVSCLAKKHTSPPPSQKMRSPTFQAVAGWLFLYHLMNRLAPSSTWRERMKLNSITITTLHPPDQNLDLTHVTCIQSSTDSKHWVKVNLGIIHICAP